MQGGGKDMPGIRVAKTVRSSYQPDFGIYILPTFSGIRTMHSVSQTFRNLITNT